MMTLRRFFLHSKFLLFSLGLLLAFADVQRTNAGRNLRSVVLTGDVAPLANVEAVFGDRFNRNAFGAPVLNDRGQTAFGATLGITETLFPGFERTNYAYSLVSEASGNALGLVVVQDDPVPGTGGSEIFRSVGNPSLNNSGHTAFQATFDGVFLDRNGVLEEAVLSGTLAPMVDPIRELKVFSDVVGLNDLGQSVFTSGLFEPGAISTSEQGIVISGPERQDLKIVARRGSAAPVSGEDVRFVGFNRYSIAGSINENGRTAFDATLTGPNVDNSNNAGIFIGSSLNDTALVARSGNPAPVLGQSLSFAGGSHPFGIPALNNQDHTAFVARLTGPGVDATNDEALFFSEGAGNGLALVAREGGPAPVDEGDVRFGRFHGPPLLNGAGQIVFRANFVVDGVVDFDDQALVRHRPGNELELIARHGDPAPVAEGGVTFGAPLSVRFPEFSLNRLGQAAFHTPLSDGSSAIFAESFSGELRVIARSGKLLDVSDDPLVQDFREIATLHFVGSSGNEDGRRSAFNDLGQLAFAASFTDGTSGVFVSNLVAVPEPSTLGLLSFGLLPSLRRRSTSSGLAKNRN